MECIEDNGKVNIWRIDHVAISPLVRKNDFQPLFVYYYYNSGDLINDGINLGYWGILLAVTAVLLGAAWWKVDDKELGI